MTDDSVNTSDLDRVIDEAVGRLMSAEPDAAFTARVVARLDDRRAGRGGRLLPRSFWVVSPLAAAAAIAMVLVVWRLGQHQHQPSRSVTPVAESVAEPMPQPGGPPTVNAPRAPRAPGPPGPPRPPGPGLAMTSVTPSPLLPSPLSPPLSQPRLTSQPLEIDAMELTDIPPADSIAVTPLEPIAPIAAEPMDKK